MWFIFVRGHCPWGAEALFLATLSEYHHQFSYAICGIYGPIYIACPWPCCQWTESFSPRQLTHTAHTRAAPKLTNQTLFFQQFYLMKTHDRRYMRYISFGSIECQTKWRYWIHLNMHWVHHIALIHSTAASPSNPPGPFGDGCILKGGRTTHQLCSFPFSFSECSHPFGLTPDAVQRDLNL